MSSRRSPLIAVQPDSSTADLTQLSPLPLVPRTRPRPERRNPANQVRLPAEMERRAPGQALSPSSGFPPQSVPVLLPAPKPRERSSHVTMRMPNAVLDRVEAICAERRIDRTALLLFFIASSLNALETKEQEKTGGR